MKSLWFNEGGRNIRGYVQIDARLDYLKLEDLPDEFNPFKII